jgi:hypothetical protein
VHWFTYAWYRVRCRDLPLERDDRILAGLFFFGLNGPPLEQLGPLAGNDGCRATRVGAATRSVAPASAALRVSPLITARCSRRRMPALGAHVAISVKCACTAASDAGAHQPRHKDPSSMAVHPIVPSTASLTAIPGFLPRLHWAVIVCETVTQGALSRTESWPKTISSTI